MTITEQDEQISKENIPNDTTTAHTSSFPPPQLDAQDDYDEDDGDEDEEEEEEGEEEDDDTNYKMRFEGEMDPLGFIENDVSAVEKYHQFQRIENQYEALAARKRKSLSTPPSSSNPAKKLRNDDGHVETFEEIMEAMAYSSGRKPRRKNKKRGRRRGSKKKVNPEVA